MIDRTVVEELAGDDHQLLTLTHTIGTVVTERIGVGRDRRGNARVGNVTNAKFRLARRVVEYRSGHHRIDGRRGRGIEIGDQNALGIEHAAGSVGGGDIGFEPRLHGAVRSDLWVESADGVVLTSSGGHQRWTERVRLIERLVRSPTDCRRCDGCGSDMFATALANAVHRQAVERGGLEGLLVVRPVEALAREILLLGAHEGLADRGVTTVPHGVGLAGIDAYVASVETLREVGHELLVQTHRALCAVAIGGHRHVRRTGAHHALREVCGVGQTIGHVQTRVTADRKDKPSIGWRAGRPERERQLRGGDSIAVAGLGTDVGQRPIVGKVAEEADRLCTGSTGEHLRR